MAQIFQEAAPERVLRRLDELLVLNQIDEALKCDEWTVKRFQTIRSDDNLAAWNLSEDERFFLHLGMLSCRIDRAAIRRLSLRLQLARDDTEDLLLLRALVQELAAADRHRPSELYHLLEPCPTRVIAAAWLAVESDKVRERLLSYQTTWRTVRTSVGGDDLLEMGLKPGPLIGEILRAVLDAKLDGVVRSEREEISLVRVLLDTKTGNAAQRARKRGGRPRRGE
jgi:tRNA nucleotidyltransferase (CCA-adding enzyme)